jgi:hypothetical protein
LVFMRLGILTLPCENIFSLINFTANNEEYFQTNTDVNVDTRHERHLHKPTVKLSCFQKTAYYAGLKIFSNLPSGLKSLMNENIRFKIALKRDLNTHSFYCVNEYFLFNK